MKVRRVINYGLLAVILALLVWFQIAYWTSTNNCERITHFRGVPMQAIINCDYGSPDVLRVREIEKPTPSDDQLLVKVRAVSVNALDGHLIRGNLIFRLLGNGLRKPKQINAGVDYSGVVEAVGKNPAAAGQFKLGDEVFGGKSGSFAEYVVVKADRAVVRKPANVTFEQAAAVPVAGVTALQGLRDQGHVHAGQKVLINGASGGVGTFAVEIAKALGAEVTAVCSTRNVELIRSIGADHVIDYTKEDFTNRPERYDVLFDNVGNHSLAERRRVLTPNGIGVLVGIGSAGWHDDTFSHLIGNLTAGLRSKWGSQKFGMFMAELKHDDLATLADMMQSGKVTPVIDRKYQGLSQITDAVRYLDEGHARGKIVIDVAANTDQQPVAAGSF